MAIQLLLNLAVRTVVPSVQDAPSACLRAPARTCLYKQQGHAWARDKEGWLARISGKERRKKILERCWSGVPPGPNSVGVTRRSTSCTDGRQAPKPAQRKRLHMRAELFEASSHPRTNVANCGGRRLSPATPEASSFKKLLGFTLLPLNEGLAHLYLLLTPSCSVGLDSLLRSPMKLTKLRSCLFELF